MEAFQAKKNEDSDWNYFEFKFTSEIHPELNLELNTYDEELTLVFDDFHWHFDRFSETDFDSEIEEAIKLIKEIQNEDIMVLRLSKGQSFNKSKLIEKKEIIELYKTDTLRNNLDWWETVKIESFKGTYDKIYNK
ncbi:hypothetical protein [Carboxylicivirga taeanensis]|uniref:hypothetical protein n=1 Tax=Carboxylicivirga taeanensis TaxID=1416875 RepID=UPI003F6DDBC2